RLIRKSGSRRYLGLTTNSSVAELSAAAGHVVVEFGADGAVERWLCVRLQRRTPNLAGPDGGVLAAIPQPALEVRGGGRRRAEKAARNPPRGGRGAEEGPAVPHLRVRVERERRLRDLQRGELHPEHAQQFDVDDELLVAAHQAAFQPARRVHDEIG